MKVATAMEDKMKVGVNAEWDKPLEIIVSTPGQEIFNGNLFPVGALYQGPFNKSEAIQEHNNLVKILSQYSNVQKVNDILLQDLPALKNLARYSLQFDTSQLNLKDKINAVTYKEHIINTMDQLDLLEVIHTQPSIIISKTGTNTDFDMIINNNPVYNLAFTRDQQITTDKGIILGNMNSSQRSSEVVIMQQVFKNLKVENLYQIEEGKLEGGDFIPAGEIGFIGVGLRTTYSAVEDLMKLNKPKEEPLVGYKEFVIVKDQFRDQDEMHLDTYFNILNKNTATILEDKVDMSELGSYKNKLNKKKELFVDVYKKNNSGRYELKEKNKTLTSYLKEKEFEVIPITLDEQRAYANNFLTVAAKEIIGIDIGAKQELSNAYKNLENKFGKSFNYFDTSINYKKIHNELMNKFYQAGINYVPIKFNMMNALYGSIHCLTQVIKRGSQK